MTGRLCVRLLDNPALPIVAYLAAIGVLFALAGEPAPPDLARLTPRWLAVGWIYSLAIGGVAATGGELTGRTRVESVGLTLLVFGLGLYGVAEILNPHGIDQALALAALLACCAIRLRVLTLSRRAVRAAHRISRRGGTP